MLYDSYFKNPGDVPALLDKIRVYTDRSGPIRLMEICGTHTMAIARSGLRSLLPPSVTQLSGPGCPVCVTVSSYIDRLIELGTDPKNCIVTFGDMLRVPGSAISLGEARAQGCSVRMVYSPMDALRLAKADPDHGYIFAAVGFETTTPVYALLVQEALEQGDFLSLGQFVGAVLGQALSGLLAGEALGGTVQVLQNLVRALLMVVHVHASFLVFPVPKAGAGLS